MAPFDPTDKKYQLKEEFPPDKESTWPYPAEKDGWVYSHDALRMELQMLSDGTAAMAKRGEILEWEVNALKTAWMAHYLHVKAHHEAEDIIFVPFIETRFKSPQKIGEEHKGLEDRLVKIKKMIEEDLKAGDKDTASKIAASCKEYQEYMIPHLKQEEDEGLRLTRAYFTQKEIAPKVQEIIGAGPKVEIGSFIAAMGAEKFRNEFMVQEGIPFFVWYIDFKYRLAAWETEFGTPVEALKAGTEPAPPASTISSYCNIL